MITETPQEICSIDQIDACAALYVKVFNAAPWNEHWEYTSAFTRLQNMFNAPEFLGYLVKDDARVIGFVLGNTEFFQQERHFYLQEICVDPAWQRQGVGARLMQTLQKRSERDNIQGIYLLTMRDSPAEQFYRKLGFSVSPKMILMSKQC